MVVKTPRTRPSSSTTAEPSFFVSIVSTTSAMGVSRGTVKTSGTIASSTRTSVGFTPGIASTSSRSRCDSSSDESPAVQHRQVAHAWSRIMRAAAANDWRGPTVCGDGVMYWSTRGTA